MLCLNTTLIRRARDWSLISLKRFCFGYLGEINNNNVLTLWSELTELIGRLITLPNVGMSYAGVCWVHAMVLRSERYVIQGLKTLLIPAVR